MSPRSALRVALLLILASAVAGCGATAPAPSSPTAAGFVLVQLEIAPDAQQFFASEHRGRIVADGSIIADWEITAAPAPVAVPAGPAQLQGFTVFLGDFLQCSADPSGRQQCGRPALAPSHVCAIPVEVVAGATVAARFRSLADGRCELLSTPSPSPARSAAAGAT